MSILGRISSPNDVKKLSIKELKLLAGEIRAFLIENVSKTGGHLAPNLGVVELTLALHYVFTSPEDSFLWDVGHQCYVHKILTGRAGRFSELRQKDGLCGFPSPEESSHDIIHAGHASTSLSIGAGIAGAKKLKGARGATLAVIGDGAFTGGMVYEALNDIAWRNLPLIMILNDNKMSISENVGGISRHFDRLRTHRWYLRTKKRVYRALEKIPLGSGLAELIYRVKLWVKGLFIHKHTIFDSLGVKYLGPFDGHDIENLIALFSYIKHEKSPVLLHILTKKGLGYKESEQNPAAFHGISAQDDSISVPGKSFSAAFGEAMVEIAEKDPRIIALTAAMREGTGLARFAKQFPERFIDAGIAEAHAVGAAVGLAQQGYRPVAAIYSTFLQRAYDQCIHDAGIGNYPVIFALDRAGLVPADGKTHQGIFDIAYLRNIPNFTIFAPLNDAELKIALKFALTLEGPFVLRYPKAVVPLVSAELPPIEMGRGFFLRGGARGVIAVLGSPLDGLFAPEWQGWALYHLRFAKPVSPKMIDDLLAFETIVLIEEGIAALGPVLKLEILARNPNARVFLKHLPDTFPPVDSREGLLARYGFSPLRVDGLNDA